MLNNKRLHFGVVFCNSDDTCQYDLWTGIVEFAKKHDIRLTAYIGTYQTTNDEDTTSHYETCYEIIKSSKTLDGLIVFSGFIASVMGNEECESYATELSKLFPSVSVSYAMPGIPSVSISNISGIFGITEHLIKMHGKKRIAFVKGPDGHFEAEFRFEGYKRALAENNITFDERFIFPGNFSSAGGEEAVRMLLKMPDLSVDAIVTCDDTTAIGVIDELRRHDVLVPTDIAVAGFDDDRSSATFIPSISTVRQDFPNIGAISSMKLLDQINGNPVEDITYTTPCLVFRQSCGCLDIELSDPELRYGVEQTEIVSLSSYLMHRLLQVFNENIPRPLIDDLASSLVREVTKTPFSKDGFLRFFNEILIKYNQYSKNIMVWNDVLDFLTMGVDLYKDEVDCSHTVLSALIHSTMLVQEIRFKETKIKELALAERRVTLRRAASNIVSRFDIDSLTKELYSSLPELSINTAIVGLYKHPIKSDDVNADRTVGTIFGFDGENTIHSNSDELDLSLFSDYSGIENFDIKSRRDFMVFPLFFADEEFGAILMPFNPDVTVDTYETLRVIISTAIKGAELIGDLGSALDQATQASKAKSAFLSTMSHEMRTPLNAIIGMTTLGKKAAGIKEKDYNLGIIEDASAHLLGVINDVLDVASIEANKLVLSAGEFDFDKMLQKVLTAIKYSANEKGQVLYVSVANNIPQIVIGDNQRLAQVITNLLSNAIKFTPKDGTINLNVSLADEADEHFQLYVEVSDSGIGMSPEQQKNLFKAFEQAESGINRNFGGTGLGLVICKKIVELMDGSMWVESAPGEGSTFAFTVKLLRGTEDEHTLQKSETGVDKQNTGLDRDVFSRTQVLLVEDVEINREIIMALLKDTGLVFECAVNGKQALDMVEAAPDRYDIIFMDVEMPLMNGYEATRNIRALPCLQGDTRLPIIAMTANVFKSDIEECLAAGMDDHVGKPIDIDNLLQVLHKYI